MAQHNLSVWDLPQLPGDPIQPPDFGAMYYNTTLNAVRAYTGSYWITMGSIGKTFAFFMS